MKSLQSLALGTLLATSMISAPALAEQHVVKMLNSGDKGSMVFEPGYVDAEPGDTIQFKSVDPAHNSASQLTPDGAESWQTQIGKTKSVTVNKEGVYLYHCDPHASLGMAGVIQVGEATNLDAAKKKAAAMEEKMVTNQGRLKDYMSQVEE